VLAEFESLGDGVAAGPMLDLAEVTRRLLERAGVRSVETAGLCTSCEDGLFFSHRRDRGRTGRQAGLVWVDGGG
jgi:purine-nucleoside/S-methyl-5'-thioadenosine phosphorylase / adenosine deaminase